MTDYLAEFKARGGVVKRAPEGAGNGMTGKDWYRAVRDPAPVYDRSPRVAVVDHCGRTWYKNEEGEVIGYD